MVKKLEIYKCEHCGNIVMVMHAGGGELICCGDPMKLLEEKTADFKTEKHVPVVEKVDGKVTVTVGSVPHPMQDEHFIEWIEAQTEDKVCIKFLKPGDEPTAEFNVIEEIKGSREFCNIHGLWKS